MRWPQRLIFSKSCGPMSDTFLTILERREKLLEWMAVRPGLTAGEIVEMSGIYWSIGWSDNVGRCRRDLKALEREGKVRRLPGRPARWEAV